MEAMTPRPEGLQESVYRVASVGQDCHLCFWDFVVTGDDYLLTTARWALTDAPFWTSDVFLETL